MTRKRAKKNSYRRTKTTQRSPIAWLLGGVFIGVLIPTFFYLKSTSATSNLKGTQEENFPAKVLHKPQKTKDIPVKEKSLRYDFYDLLSNHRDNALQGETQETLNHFKVEIAEFKNFGQADQLKAQLSLIGIDNISIERSSHEKNAYKVVAGPFLSREHALEIQKRLAENDINSQLVEK